MSARENHPSRISLFRTKFWTNFPLKWWQTVGHSFYILRKIHAIQQEINLFSDLLVFNVFGT